MNDDDNDIIRKMIEEETISFEIVWKSLLQRSRKLDITIGTKDEMAATSKQLHELEDITNQATETTDDLSSEIESLRISLNEAFSMATEANSKHELFKNME